MSGKMNVRQMSDNILHQSQMVIMNFTSNKWSAKNWQWQCC